MSERLADMSMRIKVTDVCYVRMIEGMHVFKWQDGEYQWDITVDQGFPIDPQKSFNVHCGAVGKIIDVDERKPCYPVVLVCTERFGQVIPLKAFMFMNSYRIASEGMAHMIEEMVKLSHG